MSSYGHSDRDTSPNVTVTRTRSMGLVYPLIHPGPGVNPTIYPPFSCTGSKRSPRRQNPKRSWIFFLFLLCSCVVRVWRNRGDRGILEAWPHQIDIFPFSMFKLNLRGSTHSNKNRVSQTGYDTTVWNLSWTPKRTKTENENPLSLDMGPDWNMVMKPLETHGRNSEEFDMFQSNRVPCW